MSDKGVQRCDEELPKLLSLDLHVGSLWLVSLARKATEGLTAALPLTLEPRPEPPTLVCPLSLLSNSTLLSLRASLRELRLPVRALLWGRYARPRWAPAGVSRARGRRTQRGLVESAAP